jgi:hypothetical protein
MNKIKQGHCVSNGKCYWFWLLAASKQTLNVEHLLLQLAFAPLTVRIQVISFQKKVPAKLRIQVVSFILHGYSSIFLFRVVAQVQGVENLLHEAERSKVLSACWLLTADLNYITLYFSHFTDQDI